MSNHSYCAYDDAEENIPKMYKSNTRWRYHASQSPDNINGVDTEKMLFASNYIFAKVDYNFVHTLKCRFNCNASWLVSMMVEVAVKEEYGEASLTIPVRQYIEMLVKYKLMCIKNIVW